MTDESNEQVNRQSNAPGKQQSIYNDDFNVLQPPPPTSLSSLSTTSNFNSLLKSFFDEPLFLSLTPHYHDGYNDGDDDDMNATGSSSPTSSSIPPSPLITSALAAVATETISINHTQTSPSYHHQSSSTSSSIDQSSKDGENLSPSMTTNAFITAANATTTASDNDKASKKKRNAKSKSSIKDKDKLGFREEVQKLKRENFKLREEIGSLRDKLHTLPLGQDSDLIENALLKNSLVEYKKFIQNCLSLSIPSERVALRSIGRQGADFAMNHLLNILASSQNGKDWKPISKSQHTFSFFNIGVDFTMCYRTRVDEKGRKVTDLRVDFVAPKLEAQETCDAMWRIHSNKDELVLLFGSSNPFEFLCTYEENDEKTLAGSEEDGSESFEKIEFQVYKEHFPAPKPPFNCAVIATKTTRDLAASTLWSRPEYTPLSAVIRDQFTPRIKSVKARNRQYPRRTPSANTNRTLRVGDVSCYINIYTVTQYTSNESSKESIDAVPHWIRSHFVTGSISWNDEAQIKKSFTVTGEDGSQNIQFVRETVPATRTVGVLSLFDEGLCIQSFEGIKSVVNENGELTSQFALAMEMFCKMVTSNVKQHRKPKPTTDTQNQSPSQSQSSASKRQKEE